MRRTRLSRILQIARFDEVMQGVGGQAAFACRARHLCNSGGFFDLPHAHRDMVRVGILMFGVFPPAFAAAFRGGTGHVNQGGHRGPIQHLEPGEVAGYGMRYTATTARRIAVLPIGYGDGFPRVRNQGAVLIHGRRAPIIGGTAMDAVMVDINSIFRPGCGRGGHHGPPGAPEEITVHELAKLKEFRLL